MTKSSWVYGLWREEALVVLEDDWATAADEELSAWKAVRTWGEARILADRTVAQRPPFDPEDVEESQDEPDDAPFRLTDLGSIGDGDWPRMPAQLSLDLISEEWKIGEEVDTVFSGPYLLITPDRAADLVRHSEESGRTVRRDALINRVGVWPDGL